MGAVAQLVEMDHQQSASLFLLVLGAIGSGMFAFLAWAVKLAISRELSKLDRARKDHVAQQIFNERIIGAFAQVGIALKYPGTEGD